MVLKGGASRKSSGDLVGLSDDERRGRMIIAAHIAGDTRYLRAPQWPAPFNGTWERVISDATSSDDTSADRLALFGEFRAAVTLAESEAASTVRTLLLAWRDLADFGGPNDPLAVRCAQGIRQHLRSEFRLNIGRPPPAKHIAIVAARSTRRFDLLPPNMREVAS